MSGYVTKPFDPTELVEIVRRHSSGTPDVIEERLKAVLTDGCPRPLPRWVWRPRSPSRSPAPAQKEFGDFATNVAMVAASERARPRATAAEAIVAALPPSVRGEGRGGGPRLHQLCGPPTSGSTTSSARGRARGRPLTDGGEPTGRRASRWSSCPRTPRAPCTIGHARNAAIGDALARLLSAAGHEVEREYYFNDAGGQMDRFGASVEARYLAAPRPGCGDPRGRVPRRIRHRARAGHPGGGGARTRGPAGGRTTSSGSGRKGRDARWREDRATLERFGVTFDTYFLEASLVEKGEIAAGGREVRARRTTSTRPRERRGSARQRSATTRTGGDPRTGRTRTSRRTCAYDRRQVLAGVRPL